MSTIDQRVTSAQIPSHARGKQQFYTELARLHGEHLRDAKARVREQFKGNSFPRPLALLHDCCAVLYHAYQREQRRADAILATTSDPDIPRYGS